MIKFEQIKKPKKVSIQAYIDPVLRANIKAIGKGSASGGLHIILESIKDDIIKAAEKGKKAS